MQKYSIPLIAIAIFVGLVSMGLKQGAIPLGADPFAIYQEPNKDQIQTGLQYENKSEVINSKINFTANDNTLFLAVGDYDNDGFEDILLVNGNSEKRDLVILRNSAGNEFQNVTSKVLNLPSGEFAFSAAVFVDLDNDGWQDLYVAQFMKPNFALKNIKGKFSFNDQIPMDQVIAPIRGINLFDFNKDGYVDLYLTSFSDKVYAGLFSLPGLTRSQFPIRDKSGSENILLKNLNGKRLEKTKDALGLADGGYTWASGIADFDNDGYPDVYVANDYGFDHFYKNNHGQFFTDISTEALGPIRSENSMGAEIGDFSNSGRLGLYVSNASKPGMPRGWNHLWQPAYADSINLRDISSDIGSDKCGFSWGAKFADLDKDGNLDLFVANGRTGQINSNNNRWLLRLYEWNLPPFLKFSKYIQIPYKNYDFAQGQKNCLFIQRAGKFVDVAQQIGITDLENGHSLAVFDFNNDGQEEFLIGNFGHAPILYQGIRRNENHWLGLKLTGVTSNRDAIGAKIKLQTKDSTQTRIIFPGNGYGNSSSKRIIFGIPKEYGSFKIEITWPNGHVQKILPDKIDRYYEITEQN